MRVGGTAPTRGLRPECRDNRRGRRIGDGILPTRSAQPRRTIFACPECGAPIPLPAHSQARRARCEDCLTLVEVPFLLRPRSSRRRDTGWAWVVIVAALAVIVVGGTYSLVRARVRADRERTLAALVAAADEDERLGHWERARDRLDAALALAHDARRAKLVRRRDAVAKRAEQEHRESLIRSVKADLAAARSLADARPLDTSHVLALCERAVQTVGPLADPRARLLHDAARALAARLISERGLVFEPIHGTFLDGAAAAEAHSRALFPLLAEQFRLRGYLPEPTDSPLRDLWDNHAPFLLETTIEESHGPRYFQSPHRTARIEARLELVCPPDPSVLWQTHIVGRTRVPSTQMNAFTAGYIGVSIRRDPEIERLLYKDAKARLIEQIPQKMNNLVKMPDSL